MTRGNPRRDCGVTISSFFKAPRELQCDLKNLRPLSVRLYMRSPLSLPMIEAIDPYDVHGVPVLSTTIAGLCARPPC